MPPFSFLKSVPATSGRVRLRSLIRLRNRGLSPVRLFDSAIAQGVQIGFKESIAPALGMSYGGRIALLPGQGTAEEFSTLVHELAHEMLHKAERRTATTGRASADYITSTTATPRFWPRAWRSSSAPPPSSSPPSKPQPPRPKATPARHWRRPAKQLNRDGVSGYRAPSSKLCKCTERRRSAASVRKKSPTWPRSQGRRWNDKTGAGLCEGR